MAVEEKELLEYACARFQESRYDEALEAFVLAYNKGYEQEWILNNIYGCYMEGNEQEFRNTYEQQEGGKKLPYEECILDFVPYREGEYYIFDKELGVFRGIFSMEELQKTQADSSLREQEFSAKVLVMNGEWKAVMNVLADAREREVYAVCRNLKHALSFLKIPELTEYMKHVKLFADYQEFQEYFHKNTAVYLPKILSGSQEELEQLAEIINKEHQYRLTPEGRNTENVLLTIGIPTHDRGNLVLERLQNLLKMQYDAEIEIAISKNGTTLYQEEYEEVGRISDARINYYDHGRELRPEMNWHYVMQMAHGKYVLLVSDEDDVEMEALEHYLKLISTHPEANVIRAKSSFFYRDIQERMHKKGGLDAFGSAFLRQNYLSGMILCRENYLQENFEKLGRFSDNIFYSRYPHEWWCAILCMKGDYIEEPVRLISEGESVLEEETDKYQDLGILKEEDGFVEDISLPKYATYEDRIRQFQGQAEFLHFIMDGNPAGIKTGLRKMIIKLVFLFELARKYGYCVDKFMDAVDDYVIACMNVIDEFPLQPDQELEMLSLVKNGAGALYRTHQELRTK